MERFRLEEFLKQINMEVRIQNKERLEGNREVFKRGGLDKIHILSDFDGTLTYGKIDGHKSPSIISMLRDGKHLSEEYSRQAHALYDKYHVFEHDLGLPLEERKRLMSEWWATHNKLLIESGLSKADLQDIADNDQVRFRDGVGDFLDFTNEKNIPVVIMSASGCGDVIKMFFEKAGKNYPNIDYVVNQFEWDENGRAVAKKGPIIHSLNKSETVLRDLPAVYERVRERKNVIQLGDGLHDLDMVKGFDYENLINIGFDNTEGRSDLSEEYKRRFDVVLKGDGDFSYVDQFLRGLEK